ncbi:MAG: hypothetical protein PVH63_08080 [Balneolaceae bacterium]|jgi:hypothetical protein
MDKNELLRRYLEGHLSQKEEREALHVIADDSDMRSMLRFEQTLIKTLNRDFLSLDSVDVPKGFSDRVMLSIEHKTEKVKIPGIIDYIKNWFRRLWVPTQIQWRPAYAFMLLLVVMISLSYPIFMNSSGGSYQGNEDLNASNMGDSIQQVSAEVDEVMLRFVYIDENAESVAVAGDFSNWKRVELSKQVVNGQQIWTGLISMSRGEHNYMFVKNGEEWITDPLAPVQHDDGFGNKNAVIYL